MSMGNYLRGEDEQSTVMATKQTVGLDHLTVVPVNFDPDDHSTREDDDASREQ
jgi:hypothetical protein